MVVDNQRIQIALADFSLPFITLPDGPLANITFTVQVPPAGQADTSLITFAGDLPASVGTHRGQSAAVTTNDGSVRFGLVKTAGELMDKTYLPWVER